MAGSNSSNHSSPIRSTSSSSAPGRCPTTASRAPTERPLDLFFRPSEENAAALLAALRAFGAPTGHLALSELATVGFTVTFGIPPSRVDLLNWLSGLTYDDAASDANDGELGSVPVRFLSRRAFVVNKTAAGRPKDLLDAQILATDDEA